MRLYRFKHQVASFVTVPFEVNAFEWEWMPVRIWQILVSTSNRSKILIVAESFSRASVRFGRVCGCLRKCLGGTLLCPVRVCGRLAMM